MSASVVPNGSRCGRFRPATDSTSGPGVAARCCKGGGSAPIISRDRLALDSWAGSTSPVTRPARSTVQWWHSARISSSLWLMYRIEQPLAANWRSVTNSRCTACGVSTEVGSSRISNCGFVSSARTISTRCRSPTDSVCTGRSGSTSNPYSPATARMRSTTWARGMVLSSPSHTFCETVSVSNSEKCWNTIEMPCARASCGFFMRTGWPFQTISPSSGCTAP
jgi:hypothetical protein